MNKIQFFQDYVIKTYPREGVNLLSSLDNEMYCFSKFSFNGQNPYCPRVERVGENSYKMKRYKFSLGTTKGIRKESVRRMLFSISFEEFVKQIEEIKSYLRKASINHRDVNPGNLLFCEEDRKLKLSDFYWAKTDNLKVGDPPCLNDRFSLDDSTSFQMIVEQVRVEDESLRRAAKSLMSILREMGKTYLDGSAGSPGKAYHKIDIPYFYKVPISKDVSKEFQDMVNNLSFTPVRVIDVGCSVGYNTFNFIRKFFLERVFCYEADPYVFSFLDSSKSLFDLHEIELTYGKVNERTEFPEVDLVVCMNIHMWIYKQLQKEKTDLVMKNLLSKCKEMFFQTAGLESSGMFVIPEFKNKKDIEDYLYSLGSERVDYISTSTAHGGFRHLFRVKGFRK